MAAMKNVRDIFLEALDRAPTDRPAYIDEACGGDSDLRQRVEALLRAHDAPGSFLSEAKPDAKRGSIEASLQAPTVDSADGRPETEDYADPTARVGAVLAGKYKLIEEIGEGGMGAVFMAQQTEPVRRTVAVKVIKAGMDSRAVLARFEAERQALAMMDHPNIAKVLDAGTTDSGRPFFVMELVKGTPITRYCDEQKLTPQQRLELFVPVCQAIQHAHQKGIIHRDIKPSNVLVAMYDDRPVPKVIDFGVAKAAGQALTDKTFMTGFGALVGTPEYMSPEQASLNNLDIDTRSDVYSLGVLLYELLTGTTPLDKQSLGRAALLEILRIVREVEAPRPSAKLSSIDTLPSVAANRGTEPARLSRLMRGELDWLVMKALEKDRRRRYETANAFSRDIQRYLADEVVEARPPSVGYRLSKFVRRHKGQVIAVSLVMLALVGGMFGTTLGLLEARRQTEEKEEARKAEAERVTERDDALTVAAQRVTERDAALEDANSHLDSTRFLLALAAYDNGDVNAALARLSSIEAKHRGWEWHYLRRQCSGGIFTIYGHSGPVSSVAFSPDGTRIVTGSWDKTAKVWDARTGMPQLELKGHTREVSSVAFSPDGTRIVTGSDDGTAKVWDARSGTPQLELKRHTREVRGVAFSPDGTRVMTGSLDDTVKIWDAQNGALKRDLKAHTSGVKNVAFSPDGTWIATGSDEYTKVWNVWLDMPEPELLWYSAGVHGVPGVAFSPDNKRIVTAFQGVTECYDIQTRLPRFELKGVGRMSSVAFSPDGTRIVTGSWDKTAKVWDARTGMPQLVLMGHTREVSSVAFSPDGTRIVTGSRDGTAKLWDARTGTPQLELKWEGNLGGFSPDGTRIVIVTTRNTAKVWDVRTGAPLLELIDRTGGLYRTVFSPDGTRIVTSSSDGTTTVWDARVGTPQFKLKGALSTCSSDGTRIVTSSSEDWTKVWDARAGTLLVQVKGRTVNLYSEVFSPDGTRMLTSSDNTPTVWDARTGMPLLELKGHTDRVDMAAFSPDGARILTVGNDGSAKVWDARTGTPLLDLIVHRGVYLAEFSPDGTRIVTRSDDMAMVWDARIGTPLFKCKTHQRGGVVAFSPNGARIFTDSLEKTGVKVWDARTGTPLLELKGHTGTLYFQAFSPDGTRIVTHSDDGWLGTLKVWHARTSQLDLNGHKDQVISAGFSPDSTRIVTGSADETAKVWDARTGKPLLELKGHTGLAQAAFSRDGTRIVTGSDDGTAKVWKVWDARTGQELNGEPIPQTIGAQPVVLEDNAPLLATSISPDGRIVAQPVGSLVELVPLHPDEDELAYRRLHTQPNLERYREGYVAARNANDEFATQFYFKLLPPAEQEIINAQAAADRALAAGRTQEALVHLATMSMNRPDDTRLLTMVAVLQAWFGQDRELADTCRRALDAATRTCNPMDWIALADICCLRPTPDPAHLDAALGLARKAVERGLHKATLGMLEYRSGHFAEAEAALIDGAKSKGGVATFYRAMSLFRHGKADEARRLATDTAAQMGPLPKDEKNPLGAITVGAMMPDHLMLWLAYREAKGLIQIDAAPAPSKVK